MSDWENVSLDNIAGGGAIERFNDALEEIIANIHDPNVEQEQTRSITLQVLFKPDKNGDGKILCGIKVNKKLAQPKPIGAIIYGGKEKGKWVAKEQHINQGNLFPGKKNEDNVTKLREA
jgi:hypothetical protein